MRGARVLGALTLACLLFAPPCRAGKPLERGATEVFAKMSVAAGQLASLAGELDIRYAAPGTHQGDHHARFWFAKPFRLRVDQVSSRGDGLELYCADQHASLYQPDRKQVVDFELGSASSGDLLPRFFSLFAIPGFVQGALLSDVESQFAIQVEEADGGWKLRLEPRPASLYRMALAIDHVDAEVDGKSMLPRLLELQELSASGAPRLLCRLSIVKLELNPKIPPSTFLYRPRPGVHHLASTDVLRDWVLEALGHAGGQGQGLLDALQRRITDLQKNPWGF